MRTRLKWSLLLVVILLVVAVPVALAYTSAKGQVNDALGNPWTHGGTVSCVQNSSGVNIGTGTIGATGAWTVNLGSPAAATCTIDPAAGPAGDPAPYTCAIPGGGGGGVLVYDCGAHSTGTGPNAVSLAGFSGRGLTYAWALIPAGLVVGALLWLRRR